MVTPQAYPESGYRPSALAEFVRFRDLTCRFPGCDEPAEVCDINHTVPFPLGLTHPSNLDTTLLGRVAVREALTLRIGYSGTDFTDNVVRTVCEECLNLAVERPAAICHITGLPSAAPLQASKASK